MHEEQYQKAQILIITQHSDGQRIDNFLFKTLKNIPKSRIYRMLRTGEVRINKKRAKASDKLMLDDQVRLPPLYQATTTEVRIPTHWQKEFANAILYDDEDLLILNKPPGIPVHGGSNADFGVIDILRQAWPEAPYLELVHRLDKDTSGCLMIAKKRDALRLLHQLLQNHTCQKNIFSFSSWPLA